MRIDHRGPTRTAKACQHGLSVGQARGLTGLQISIGSAGLQLDQEGARQQCIARWQQRVFTGRQQPARTDLEAVVQPRIAPAGQGKAKAGIARRLRVAVVGADLELGDRDHRIGVGGPRDVGVAAAAGHEFRRLHIAAAAQIDG